MAIKNNKKITIGIFGYGHMGQAILKLLQKEQKLKGKLNFFIRSIGVKKITKTICLNSFDELIKKCDYIFLCLKPQEFYNLKPAAFNNKTFISIMAGVKIDNIKKIVRSQNVIRTMPNLPLTVGQGVIAWRARKKNFSAKQINFITELFSCFGYNFRVNRETDLDKITAISGSGPAYVFLFMDALIQAAINLGFAQKQAEEIILHLLDGSLEYFKSVKNIYTPGQLINMVKSKKGTTEAALNKLNAAKFYETWRLAIGEAYKRAEQLSNYAVK